MAIVDLRTPLLLAAMMALAFGGVLFALRRSLAIQGLGVRRWTDGDLALGVAMLLLALHGTLPEADRFKALNDRHGHAAGDDAIARFARIAEAGIRAGDVLGRYGGEEFVGVLPDTTERTAAAIAERVRSMVEDDASGAGSPPRCTASIGVVGTTEPASASLDELLRAADKALYRAKRTRNAVASAAAPDALAETAVAEA